MYFMNNLEINISYSQIKDQMADCFHKFWYSFTYLLTAVRIGFFGNTLYMWYHGLIVNNFWSFNLY